MPIKRFWFLLSQIERLRAEAALDQMQIMASVTSQEAYEATTKELKGRIGEIYVFETKPPTGDIVLDPETGLDPEFDRAALRAMKARLAAGR